MAAAAQATVTARQTRICIFFQKLINSLDVDFNIYIF